MAYLLSNICVKNYWNQTTIVEIIVGDWVVFFFWDTVYAYESAFGYSNGILAIFHVGYNGSWKCVWQSL